MTSKQKLEKLKSRLEQYYEAERKVLLAQSCRINSRSYTRADLGEIRTMITELEGQIETLERRGTTKRRVARAYPIDH